jgi:hypothetical protein
MGWSEPLTHRQFAAWAAWWADEWNRPSRSDQYLMQVALEVRRAAAKHPGRVKIERFRLRFTGEKASQPRTRERAAELARAKWLPVFGLKPEDLPPVGE